MLSIYVKDPISIDLEREFFENYEDCLPHISQSNVNGFAKKLSIYAETKGKAERIVDNLTKFGKFRFYPQFRFYAPIFRPELYVKLEEESDSEPIEEENPPVLEPEPAEPERGNFSMVDYKPMFREGRAVQFSSASCSPSIPANTTMPENYVTMEQFQKFSEDFKKTLSQTVAAAMRTPTFSAPPPPPASVAIRREMPQTQEFKAKNELIANGIQCEKCHVTIKNIEPIGKMIMAVRDHVIAHFNDDNPMLKRYECRECGPPSRTNFVDDFEKHLKRHGTMMSLPEKRAKLMVNLLTPNHLKIIAALSGQCFPDVFEKIPPAINTIHAIETPDKAKRSVFPPLNRLFCTRYSIPGSAAGRNSNQPIPVVQINN